MKLFVGIPKGTMGVTIIAEFVSIDTIKNVAMAVEMATERGFALSFHPNPYFCVEGETNFDGHSFLLTRVIEDPSEKVFQDYAALMTRVRASRSGIVSPERGFAKSLMENLK